MTSIKYRPEIDGLRTIAVVPVILFHAGFTGFGGGFVGVDVFFVISGYLITSIIAADLDRGRFSIVTFYERRARRILPALFFVMACAVPAAWALMTTAQLRNFAESLVAVSLFSSNVLFWLESGYFDSAAELKPLLHTWSLAVEEQYYIVFPLLLMLCWRFGRSKVFWMLVALSALSLAFSEWGWRHRPSMNFYLLPSRAWELLAGALAALTVREHGVRASHTLSLAGLAMILVSITVYTPATPFPSLYALLPVGGTVLVMLYGGAGSAAARLLGLRPLVGIGLISYSAYLWHQPLLAYARLVWIETPPDWVMGMMALASLGLAAISWRWVERPFRDRRGIPAATIFRAGGAGLALFLAIGVAGHMVPQRVVWGQANPLNAELQYDGFEPDNWQLGQASWRPLRRRANDGGYQVIRDAFDDTAWFDEADPRAPMLLIGNSHSKDLYNVLSHSRTVSEQYQLARYGVQIRDIAPGHPILSSPNFEQATVVTIATLYAEADIARLPEVVALLRSRGKRVVLIENIHEFEEYRLGAWSMIDKIAHEAAQDGVDPAHLPDRVNHAYWKAWQARRPNGRVSGVNAALRTLAAARPEVALLDRMEHVCDDARRTCYAMGDGLEKYFYDYGHHTMKGAAFFGARIDALGWFPDVAGEV